MHDCHMKSTMNHPETPGPPPGPATHSSMPPPPRHVELCQLILCYSLRLQPHHALWKMYTQRPYPRTNTMHTLLSVLPRSVAPKCTLIALARMPWITPIVAARCGDVDLAKVMHFLSRADTPFKYRRPLLQFAVHGRPQPHTFWVTFCNAMGEQGSVDMLEWWLSDVYPGLVDSGEGKLHEFGSALWSKAAAFGHVAFLNRLKVGGIEAGSGGWWETCIAATRAGHLDALDWLHQAQMLSQDPPGDDLVSRLLQDCCAKDDTRKLEWWFNQGGLTKQHVNATHVGSALAASSEKGFLQVLDWLYRHYGLPSEFALGRLLAKIASQRQYAILDWWTKSGVDLKGAMRDQDKRSVSDFALSRDDHLLLAWLKEHDMLVIPRHSYPPIDPAPLDTFGASPADAFFDACRDWNEPLMKWIVSQDSSGALREGRDDCLRWAFEGLVDLHGFEPAGGLKTPVQRLDWWSSELGIDLSRTNYLGILLESAANRGEFKLLDWWWQRFGPKIQPPSLLTSELQDRLEVAAREGAVDVLKWCAERWPIEIGSYFLNFALLNGHIAVLDFYMENGGVFRKQSLIYDMYGRALGIGQSAAMEWIVANKYPIDFDQSHWHMALDRGHLAAVRLAYAHKPGKVERMVDIEAFEVVCAGGDGFKVLDWFVESFMNGQLPLEWISVGLFEASDHGRLQTFQYLLQKLQQGYPWLLSRWPTRKMRGLTAASARAHFPVMQAWADSGLPCEIDGPSENELLFTRMYFDDWDPTPEQLREELVEIVHNLDEVLPVILWWIDSPFRFETVHQDVMQALMQHGMVIWLDAWIRQSLRLTRPVFEKVDKAVQEWCELNDRNAGLVLSWWNDSREEYWSHCGVATLHRTSRK